MWFQQAKFENQSERLNFNDKLCILLEIATVENRLKKQIIIDRRLNNEY